MGGVPPELSAEQLLRLPVRLSGMDIGYAVDLILDPGQRRALGLDVLCRDGVERSRSVGCGDRQRHASPRRAHEGADNRFVVGDGIRRLALGVLPFVERLEEEVEHAGRIGRR